MSLPAPIINELRGNSVTTIKHAIEVTRSLIKPFDPIYWMEEGISLFENNHWEEAIIAFNRVLRIEYSQLIYPYLFFCNFYLSRYNEADKILKRLLEENKMYCLDGIKYHYSFLHRWESCLKVNYEWSFKTFVLLDIFSDEFDFLQNGVLSESSTEYKLGGFWQNFFLGYCYNDFRFSDSSNENGSDYFNKAEIFNPNSSLLYHHWHNINDRVQSEEFLEEKVKFQNKAISIYKYPCYFSERGRANLRLRRYEKCINDFTTSIDLKNQFNTFCNRGVNDYLYFEFLIPYYYTGGSNSEWIEYCTRGIAKSFIKDYSGALDDINRCIKLTNGIAESYFNRAKVYAKIGNLDEALNDYSKAISLEKDNDLKYLYYSYRGFLKRNLLNDLSGSIADFTEARDLDIEVNMSLTINDEIIKVQEEIGDNLGLIESYSYKLCVIDSDDNSYCKRADVKMRISDFQGAISDYSEAISMKINDAYYKYNRHPSDHFYLAGLYFKRGAAYSSINNVEKANEDYEIYGRYVNFGYI